MKPQMINLVNAGFREVRAEDTVRSLIESGRLLQNLRHGLGVQRAQTACSRPTWGAPQVCCLGVIW